VNAPAQAVKNTAWRDAAILALALAASLAAIWFIAGDPLVVAGFGAGVITLGSLALLWLREVPDQEKQDFALPDWSVTVAALDRQDLAVAITDRAQRLVCANGLYQEWFGVHDAPPRLKADAASLERLARAARSAWRDGTGRADLIEHEGRRWQAEAERAGRGEDFLVWRLREIRGYDPVAELSTALGGKVGRALSQAGIAAALVDPAGAILSASGGFAERATGDAKADLAGRDFVSFLHQDEGDRITWAREGRSGAPIRLHYIPVADPDLPGEPDPDTTPSLMLTADAGAGIGAGADGDSSGAVPHLEALLAQLPLGLAMADRDGRLLFANVAFMRAAGREGEPAPTYPTDLVVQEDKGPVSDAIRRFAQGPATSGDIAIRLATQGDEPVSLSLAGVRGLGDASVLLGLTDTSEETRLKRQVAQATKMQAVGQLAGGVAHDFNNVLTAILGTCDLMLMRHTPGDSDYDDIIQIKANSSRAASLTRQLLAFSRQQTLRPEVVQLPDIVTDIAKMVKRIIGEKIRLEVRHDRNLGPVRADPTQIEQVIVNLCVNARDAMLAKPGGPARLTLSTRRVTANDVRAMRSDILPIAEYTALVVEDTGSGIAPEHQAKIFEPFFTTKDQGKGTGLGLSTVYGIVKQSGGFIFAESEPGKGTRFSVYLPVHMGEQSPTARPGPVEDRRQWAGGGSILLVEDEDPVRMVAERALTRAGYTVVSARDGEEGLEKVSQGGRFDLVVSDVVMPGMDGPSMVREIRKRLPEMPVLFMSGYAEEQLRKEIDIEGVHFLPKPFTVQQIGDMVGSVIAARQQATSPG